MPEIESWLMEWCERELGSLPVEQLLASSQMSEVTALRLTDGREVVIKARPDPSGRVETCLAVQRMVAEAGLPCARPLTGVTHLDALPLRDPAAEDPSTTVLAVHAEEWRAGGEIVGRDDVAAAERSARLYAAVCAITNDLQLKPPLPNPEWVHWDHTGPGHWPPNPIHDHRPGADSLPADLVAIASRARTRLAAAANMKHVLGHADWEAQNMRWQDGVPYVIHDWDSMAWLPEPALVGAAAGAFASNQIPTLAPLASSEAFLNTYQKTRNRTFTHHELEIAWAASLWPALHNARAELLWNHPPVALTAVLTQAKARLTQSAA